MKLVKKKRKAKIILFRARQNCTREEAVLKGAGWSKYFMRAGEFYGWVRPDFAPHFFSTRGALEKERIILMKEKARMK